MPSARAAHLRRIPCPSPLHPVDRAAPARGARRREPAPSRPRRQRGPSPTEAKMTDRHAAETRAGNRAVRNQRLTSKSANCRCERIAGPTAATIGQRMRAPARIAANAARPVVPVLAPAVERGLRQGQRPNPWPTGRAPHAPIERAIFGKSVPTCLPERPRTEARELARIHSVSKAAHRRATRGLAHRDPGLSASKTSVHRGTGRYAAALVPSPIKYAPVRAEPLSEPDSETTRLAFIRTVCHSASPNCWPGPVSRRAARSNG